MVLGGTPAGNAFWRILKAPERSFLHPYADAVSEFIKQCFVSHWGQGRDLGQLSSCLDQPTTAPGLLLYKSNDAIIEYIKSV